MTWWTGGFRIRAPLVASMWWTFAWLTSSSWKFTCKTRSVSKWRCPLFASLFWLEMIMTQTRMNANCEVPASCECDNLRIQLSWTDYHRSSQITSLEDLGRISILSITDHTYPHNYSRTFCDSSGALKSDGCILSARWSHRRSSMSSGSKLLVFMFSVQEIMPPYKQGFIIRNHRKDPSIDKECNQDLMECCHQGGAGWHGTSISTGETHFGRACSLEARLWPPRSWMSDI